MKFNHKIWVIFLLITCFFAFYAEAGESSGEGGPAFDFKLKDLAGNTFTLSTYKDKYPVVLFFWTTWCPFCRQGLKKLNDNYAELKKEGWQILAIDVGEPLYRVDNFVKNYFLNFDVLLDKDTLVAGAYNILGVPTYVLVDKKGYVVFQDNYFPYEAYKRLISK
jgi:peroxiredoxin